jgi:hypothetical protein
MRNNRTHVDLLGKARATIVVVITGAATAVTIVGHEWQE